MRCTTCQAENLADALFCEACGAALETSCPACGAGNRPAARFCRRCGAALAAGGTAAGGRAADAPAAYTPRHLAERILRSRGALEGERKQVTVLFADVKGSMELAERIDPEEWHRIMDRFFAILTDGVHRFDGTINQYTGDGIMALFGAPLAHEDHAQRAGYAALHLRDALRRYADELRLSHGLNFSVRMGLNSGEVVVGKIGDDLRMDYTAQGHTVGLAARMEQLASPGTVLLTESTARLISGYFALRDLGPYAVKGVSEPLHVYELEGLGELRSRLDVSRARGFSRFVGRAREMALLEAALERIGGGGQVIGIGAEAGTGKSRLCYEFAQRCRARGMEVLVAAGVPYGKAVPFLPVLQVLRALCGITEHEGSEEARRKIAGTLLLRDPEFQADLPMLFDFLGVGDPGRPAPRMDPEALQRQLFGVVQRLIRTRTAGGLAVLIFEDLQWMDGASAAALESLIEAVPATPTLLVLNFRPGFHAPWMQRSSYEQLPLLPLGDAAITELLHDLLGSDPALAALAGRIRERTAGNPFFVEEIVQQLAETGSLAGSRGAYRPAAPVAEIALPATVHAVLAARIDRLPEREKAVLQTAAVIGKEFAQRVLLHVAERPADEVGAALRTLVDADFVYEAALYPELLYVFKHPLTQEVAYRSQLGERRARVHAAVAQAIETVDSGKLDERAALLAHHWEHAGDAVRAAEWHGRAAAWVGARDRGEMLRHWRQVRQLLHGVPASPATGDLGLLACIQILHNGLFLGLNASEAAAVFAEASELAARGGDPTRQMWLLADYAMVQLQSGAVAAGLTHAREGVALADRSGDVAMRLMTRIPLAWLHLHAGPLTEALRVVTEAETLAGGDPELGADVLGFSPYGNILVLRGATLASLGRLDEAAHVLQRAVEVGSARRDAEVLHWAHGWYVFLYDVLGDAEAALAHARRGVEFGETAGSVGLRAAAFAALGEAYLVSQRCEEAAEALERACRITGGPDTGAFVESSLHLSFLAKAYRGLGDLRRAGDAAARAVAGAAASPRIEITALLEQAHVLLAAGAPADEIETLLGRAATLIAATGAEVLTPFLHLARAALAERAGDTPANERERHAAERLFRAMGAHRRAAAALVDIRPQSR